MAVEFQNLLLEDDESNSSVHQRKVFFNQPTLYQPAINLHQRDRLTTFPIYFVQTLDILALF